MQFFGIFTENSWIRLFVSSPWRFGDVAFLAVSVGVYDQASLRACIIMEGSLLSFLVWLGGSQMEKYAPHPPSPNWAKGIGFLVGHRNGHTELTTWKQIIIYSQLWPSPLGIWRYKQVPWRSLLHNREIRDRQDFRAVCVFLVKHIFRPPFLRFISTCP